MSEDKTKEHKPISRSRNIEEILRERDRLEQILREKFKKKVVILFTDICGYTKYTEIHGDISARALVEKHNQIVFPLIEKHHGMVIKTIGDAVMASFSSPLDIIKASIAIQKGLNTYNQTAEATGQIHLKIGGNIGQALVDGGDIFGDMVNVASRIQSYAGPDQILISRSLYEQVRGIEDILCRFHGTFQVKGKAEAIELYRVEWRNEDIIVSTAPKVRASKVTHLKKAQKALKVIHLEVARKNAHLKISANEHLAGEVSTIRHYEEIPVSMDWIGTKCSEMVETLNAVNRQGRFGRDILLKLRAAGRDFYKELLTPSVKEKLKETKAEYLSLHIDDHLVQVPWELLNDGREFLCQRFNVGRLVKTRQAVQNIKNRVLARPLRMLVIADPMGDLKDAYLEGKQIQEYMTHYENFIHVVVRSKDITPAFIKEKMQYFDFVHFAGHADYHHENPEKSGWGLTKGTFTARDIIKMADSSTMPALIFSNACQSARTENWALKEHFQDEIFGLANAFLLTGVKHYVGTFWEMLDEPSSRFAPEFYKNLLSGMSTGEAVKEARLSLIKEYGEETVAWASYLLYGDPTSNYMDQIKVTAEEEEQKLAGVFPAGERVRAREREADLEPAAKEVFKKTAAWWVLATGVALFSLLLLIFFPVFRQSREKPIPQNMTFSPGTTFPTTPGVTIDSDFQKTLQIIQFLSSYQDQLSKRFKEKGFFSRARETDTWTSTPVSICMISPNWEKIDPGATESIKPYFEKILKKMTETFTRTHSMGLSILDRERLAVILQELQIGIPHLSTGTLKEAHTMLSAQIILFPEPGFYQFDQEKQREVSLRLVETKSTKIIAAFSIAFSPQLGSIDKAVSELADKTIRTLQDQYPLQGKIISINDQTVEINLGSSVGVSQDQAFLVLSQTEKEPPKGAIQIKTIYDHTTLAKILEQQMGFKVGDRIKAKPQN